MKKESINQRNLHNQLAAIRYKLWSINKLPLPDIYNALLQLIPLQSLNSFIPMTRECISVSKRDRYLIKYLYLFDMLLNHQAFNQLLHSCLVEFFSRIVSHLNKQKLWEQIEQSKILRKYWTRRIHYKMYEDIKTETYQSTGIDVDNILSVEAIQNIRQYYVNVLRLPQHQLFYFLPQINPIQPAYYSNLPVANKILQSNKFKHQNDHIAPTKYTNEVFAYQNNVQKTNNVFNPLNFITNSNVNTKDNNTCFSNQPNTHNQNSVKRIRCQSEQTNPGDNLEILRKVHQLNNHQTIYINPNTKMELKYQQEKQNEPRKLLTQKTTKESVVNRQNKPRKQKTKDELEAQSMLAKLNSLNCHECKQCGMRFQTEQSRQQHADWHVTSRLKKLDIEEAIKFGSIKHIKKPSFLSSTVWTAIPQQEQNIQFNLVQDEQANLKQFICPLCCSPIQQNCLGQQWVYKNTIRTILSSPIQKTKQPFLIHKSCAKLAAKSEDTAGSPVIPIQ